MDSVSHAPRYAPGGAIAAPAVAPRLGRADARRTPNAYLLIGAASLLLAVLSLPLQAAPGYDPWAWIIWGREIVHLSLITTGGPSWKPLPVIFTSLFAPFGAAAPALWLVVARAGGIAAVALAAVMAARLVGGRGRHALIAGGLAGTGILTLYGFGSSVATGESEGLLAALLLLAILRHLDGHPRQAFGLGVAVALLRPETWPFLALYGVFLWRRDPEARVWIVAAAAATMALWFLPELWGSGSLLRSVTWARHPRAGSPALARCPSCAEVTSSAWPLLVMPLKIGVVLALAVAVRRSAGRRFAAALGLLGVAWILEEAVLTQFGFSGSDRYLLAPAAVLIAVGASGLTALHARPRAWVAAAAVVLVLSVPAYGKGPHFGPVLRSLRAQADVRANLEAAIQRAGGRDRVVGCGAIQTNPSEAPLVAWALRVPMSWTESGRGSVLIESPGTADPTPEPLPPEGGHYRLVASTGSVKLFESC